MRVRAHCTTDFAYANALARLVKTFRARPNSSNIKASLSPKVIGSAWTPWLRPIIGVILNRRACLAIVDLSISSPASRIAIDSVSCTANVVSRMSDDVRP